METELDRICAENAVFAADAAAHACLVAAIAEIWLRPLPPTQRDQVLARLQTLGVAWAHQLQASGNSFDQIQGARAAPRVLECVQMLRTLAER